MLTEKQLYLNDKARDWDDGTCWIATYEGDTRYQIMGAKGEEQGRVLSVDTCADIHWQHYVDTMCWIGSAYSASGPNIVTFRFFIGKDGGTYRLSVSVGGVLYRIGSFFSLNDAKEEAVNYYLFNNAELEHA